MLKRRVTLSTRFNGRIFKSLESNRYFCFKKKKNFPTQNKWFCKTNRLYRHGSILQYPHGDINSTFLYLSRMPGCHTVRRHNSKIRRLFQIAHCETDTINFGFKVKKYFSSEDKTRYALIDFQNLNKNWI